MSDSLSNVVQRVLKNHFENKPILSRSGKYELHVNNIRITPVNGADISLQRNTKLRGKSFADQIVCDASIIDVASKKVLDSHKGWVMTPVPVKTQRSSYIVKGNEWEVVQQLRLKQAPFVRHKREDNLHEGFINAAGGAYRVVFDDKTLLFRLRIGTKHFLLYSILHDLGVPDSDLQQAWGKDVFDANKAKYDAKIIVDLYKRMRPYAKSSDLKADVTKYMESKKLDPNVTRLTIGEAHDSINPKLLVQTSEKVLKLVKNEIKPDDTEHLAYHNLLDEKDIMEERLNNNVPLIIKQVQSSLDRKQTLAYAFTPLILSKVVLEFFTRNELSRYTDQFNPLSILRTSHLVTIRGEGGIASAHAISDDMRGVHPSHMGVLDPSATPEGTNIGVINHLSLGAKKIGKEIGLEVYDAKTGEKHTKLLVELADKKMGFYEDFDFKHTPPKPKKKQIIIKHPDGSLKEGKPSEIDYIFRSAHTFWDPVGNSVPFIESNSGNRVLMGTRHIEQAVALKNPDKPWVQSEILPGKGYEDFVGQNITTAPVDGVVIKKTSDSLTIKDKSGKTHVVYIHKKYPLNESALMDESFLVSKGDKVTKGQNLAESIYSKKGKSLTIGKNVRVGFMPYYGYNFEDGTVISESCAKKFTSLHKHEEMVELNNKMLFGIDQYVYHFPNMSQHVHPNKFNNKDIPKAGAVFHKGDVIVPIVMKTEPTPELEGDRLIKKLGYKPVDASVVWEKDLPGTVVSSIKSAKFIKVLLETEEPIQVGDKMCVTEDHEVLTSDGWKVISQVSITDKIATLNGRCVEFHRPTKFYSYAVDEALFHVENDKISFFVTAEHKCWVRKHGEKDYKFVEAKNLEPREYFFNTLLGEKVVDIDKYGHWKHYKGRVYCVEVQNHIFYTKRDGKPHWTGNSSRHGSKGIVIKIVPDAEMVRDKEGKALDVLFNPFSMPGRVNPGLFFEAALGKVGSKQNAVQLVKSFSGVNNIQKIKAILKRNHITDKEDVYDPVSGEWHKIFVGEPHFYKLTHLVRKKMSARGAGAGEQYTIEESPKRASGESGQSAGVLELYAILAGNGLKYLKDVSTLVSQKNDAWWRAYQLGLPTPPLDLPFVAQKFLTYMRGAGVDLEAMDDGSYKAVPLTDDKIIAQSNGAIENPKVIDDKLNPEQGGLFDPARTGGLSGVYWNHIPLTRPIPNPIAEEAIIKVLDIKTTEFDKLMEGKLFYDKETKKLTPDVGGVTQGEAIEAMLKEIDVDKELANGRERLKKTKGIVRNNVIKRLKYLQGIKNLEKRPEEVYVLRNLPVIPAKFRPVYTTPDGKVNVSDPTQMYHEVMLVNSQLKDLDKAGFDLSWSPDLTNNLYNSAKALIGLGDPQTPNAMFKGFFKIIKGAENKFGLFQGRVVSRRRDLSGRSTIVVNPSLGIDEVGVPKKLAVRMYAPFITKRLINTGGMTPIDVRDLMEKDPFDPRIIAALEAEVMDRPVLLSRAPTLHKFSDIGQKVKLVDGDAIQTNALVIGGLNADFDGDSLSCAMISIRVVPDEILRVFSNTEVFNNLSRTIKIILTNADLGVKSLEELNNLKEIFMLKLKQLPMSDNGFITIINIEDFPHDVVPFKEENGVTYHSVPQGIYVSAIDESGLVNWCPVTVFTVHHELDRYEVTFAKHGVSVVSKDNTILSCDLDTYKIKKILTSDAAGKLAPYTVSTLSASQIISEIDLTKYISSSASAKLLSQSTFILDKEGGYLLGALIGDGWSASNTKGAPPSRIGLANTSHEVVTRFRTALSRYISVESEYKYENPHVFDGKDSYSESYRWTSVSFGTFLADTVKQGSANKRLPSWFANTSEEFRLGLLEGLIDTDGSLSKSSAGKYAMFYHSENLALVKDVQYLLLTFNVFSSVTTYTKSLHGITKEYYMLVISTYDAAQQLRGKIILSMPAKQKVWQELQDKDWGDISKNPVLTKEDVIPITTSLAQAFSKRIGAKRSAPDEEKCLYAITKKALKTGSVSRGTAKRLIEKYPIEHDHFATFKSFAENETLKWDRVESVHIAGKETMYDITVPGPCTFMTADGMFYWDSCLGNIHIMEKISIHPIVSERKYPIETLCEEGQTYIYKPEQDISNYVEFKTSNRETIDLKQEVYTPGVSIINNLPGVYQVTQWHRHPNCREVNVSTWYDKNLIVSSNHSLVVYDPYEEKFIKARPTDCRFKCVPVMLGFDGREESLFGLGSHDASFVMYTYLFGKVVNGRVQYRSKKPLVIDRVSASIGVAKIDKYTAEITDAYLNQLVIDTFNLEKGVTLPHALWVTSKVYRKDMLRALCAYSLYISRYDNKVFPTIRLSTEQHTEGIRQLLLSLGLTFSEIPTDNSKILFKLNREAFLYHDIFEMKHNAKPIGVLPVTDNEFNELAAIIPALTRNVDAPSKFVPMWQLLKAIEQNDLPETVKARMGSVGSDYYFDAVTHVTVTGEFKEMYDLTVPGSLTFTTDSGVVLFDTTALAVPVTEEARVNALEMMPSHNLFSPRSNAGESLVHLPTKEYALGIYMMSKPVGDKSKHTFKNDAEALEALSSGRIKINDLIKIGGKETCVGRIVIKNTVPDDIDVPDGPVNKKSLGKILNQVANKHPERYDEVVNRLKDYGAYFVTALGYTFGLDELDVPIKERDAIMKDAIKNIKTKGFSAAMSDADAKLSVLLSKMDNSLIEGAITSGALGKANQIQQMILSPVAMVDHKGDVIEVPLSKSYVEGYSLPEYWVNLPGSRKGLIDKGLSTQDTGAFGKVLLSSIGSLVIRADDCKTKEGIVLSTDDKNVLDRVVANGQYIGQVVTPELQRNLIAKGVKSLTVRSPLKCKLGDGLCAKCWGLSEDGKFPEIGFPIGALVGTTAAEPVTQLVLRCTISNVIFKYKGRVHSRSFEDLWDMITTKAVITDGIETKNVNSLYMWDKRGWVKATSIQRHKPTAPMRFLRASTGDAILVQENHPIEVYTPCPSVDYSGAKRRSKIHLHSDATSSTYFNNRTHRVESLYASDLNKLKTIKAVKDVDCNLDGVIVNFTLPRSKVLTLEISPYLLGFYAAEGCLGYKYRDKKKWGNPCSIVIAQQDSKNNVIKDKVFKLCKAVGSNAVMSPKHVRISSVAIAKKFNKLVPGKASHKRFNFDFMFLDDRAKAELICGVLDGDGYCKFNKYGAHAALITTTSFILIQQIAMLCRSLDFHYLMSRTGDPSKWKNKAFNGKDVRQTYTISISVSPRVRWLLRHSLKLSRYDDTNTTKQSRDVAYCGVFRVSDNTKISDQNFVDDYVYDVKTVNSFYQAGFIRNHNSFHTGGSIGSSNLGWKAIDALMKLPATIPSRAVLATVSGKVSDVQETSVGSYKVIINDVAHMIPKVLGISVKKGDHVNAGDNLTIKGMIHPTDLLEITGDVERVENHMISELDSTYKGGGVTLKRKILETLVAPMTKSVQVDEIDPRVSQSLGIYPGDYITRGEMETLKKYKDKVKLQATPKLTSIKSLPHLQNDLLMELMSDSPHKSLAMAPLIQKRLDPSASPVSQFVFGTIGDKQDVKQTKTEKATELLERLSQIFDTRGILKELDE